MTMPESGFQPDSGGFEADDTPVTPPAPPSPAGMPRQITQEQQAAADDDLDLDDEPDDDNSLDPDRRLRRARNEARNLRGRLRDTETERDALTAVVDGLRRSEVQRLAAAELADARDLLDRHAVADFLDEAGHVDPAKVSAAARALIADRPHTAAPPVVTAPPTNRPLESLRPGASPEMQPQETTWASALRPLVG
ncbi:hypothetical protein Y900_024145 [Mycolicibacterium aromaticivorans JS19b1 = JCM 16368]|uniref:Uncharacterized protein n=2 Tax=Mycolicibacterium aromaticivorans TaxID=318425 RepID=A0A064CTA1_9MYCO|nr:hypothetical protein Y900_024145 [Mycolicibacterium aromaticivorans JS19b1 = JCM 16368]